MKLRRSLIEQGPSLVLQRAAQDEIAMLDHVYDAARALSSAFLAESEQPQFPALNQLLEALDNFEMRTGG